MTVNISAFASHQPLSSYPWQQEIDALLEWLQYKPHEFRPFCYDLVMSMAFADATAGLEKQIAFCPHTPYPYNAHLGFINLCAPCLEGAGKWSYQKAAKPSSGALGKLSSEVILRFIQGLYPNFDEVHVLGGVATIDAILKHRHGLTIAAEVKAAPLLTYPLLFAIPELTANNPHKQIELTSLQLRACESALYLHGKNFIPLGKVGRDLWPFRPAIEYLLNPHHANEVQDFVLTWQKAQEAYRQKNRQTHYYYLANASGHPPQIARQRDNWPTNETVSDSKTSAGLDRTDDIKKGIYQVLKIGLWADGQDNLKTALISNLPAYRHGEEYLRPFESVLWGRAENIIQKEGEDVLSASHLSWLFDFVITLQESILRGLEL